MIVRLNVCECLCVCVSAKGPDIEALQPTHPYERVYTVYLSVCLSVCLSVEVPKETRLERD